MNAALKAQQRYRDDAILSAAPERLLTMLYDRLLLDIERGEAALRRGDWSESSTQLQHAQSIVAELNASLTDAWDGAGQLRAVYTFLTQTLIGANIGRDPERAHACLEIVAPLRVAWHTASESLVARRA
ncbi:flagellar protein FliS [Microbacterium sp. W4I4]|uniref:flagellar export chaperone FliS n=1 Tax=Microbacterium sp. W4I4 TaxID=3042295 RepID=UPI0027811835|nr:flagellar export chaperone FliS [Microbacterium sp. W4I4]MDQ0613713.1 flagellar protein FliS [Microbacterium sp. W4I4]